MSSLSASFTHLPARPILIRSASGWNVPSGFTAQKMVASPPTSFRCTWKSSSPKAGAMWTMPVPASSVTKSAAMTFHAVAGASAA